MTCGCVCVCVCFLPVCICKYVFSLCFLCEHSSVRLCVLDNDIHELFMSCDAFHSISALIFPQTTLQRRVSGHLAVNKLELIDFDSGQHPSAKQTPGSKLNKTASKHCSQVSSCARLLTVEGTGEVKENGSVISILRAFGHPLPNTQIKNRI